MIEEETIGGDDIIADLVEERIKGLFRDLPVVSDWAKQNAERALIASWNDYLSEDQGLDGLITEYYAIRELVWPRGADEALDWALTELAEAKELLLARRGNWVRNNPEAHPDFSRNLLEAEMADMIMMVLVAGMVEGLNPLSALHSKLRVVLSRAER